MPPPLAAPLIHSTVVQLLQAHLKPPYSPPSALFGLDAYTENALLQNGFTRAGDTPFILYEKNFRLLASPIDINCKVYFDSGQFTQTGLDFAYPRIATVLQDFQPFAKLIHAVQMLLDPSGAYGSLIINGMLELRFARCTETSQRQKYKLIGLSTDFDTSMQSADAHLSTTFARALKPEISMVKARQVAANNAAMKQMLLALEPYGL